MNEATLKRWTDQAQLTLKQAQQICTEAEESLKSQAYELTEHLPGMFSKCSTLIDGMKHQHDGLAKITEKNKEIVASTIDSFTKWEHELEPSMKNLDKIILQLGGTHVPSSLVVMSNQEGAGEMAQMPKTLSDFISLEEIDHLKKEIEVQVANSKKIVALLEDQFREHIYNPFKNCAKGYARITKQFEEILPLQLELRPAVPGSEPHSLINTLIKENSSLENELVSILEMLTNHYDQCLQGLQLIRSGKGSSTEMSELLSVLENDAVELSEVLKELNTVCDIVFNNERRSSKLINNYLPLIDQTISQIQDTQLPSYRKLRSHGIPKLMVLCDIVSDIASGNTHYIQTLDQLTYHYTQFLDVYRTKYLTELHYEKYTYPRKFLGQLTDFLNDTIHQLQIKEDERRKNWLLKYGEFIPRELALPGDKNQPMIVQVITEGLDEIQNEAGEPKIEVPEETELLRLISSLR